MRAFLIIVILSFPLIIKGQCPQPMHPDYDGLMQLYNATGGANWTINTGWVDGAAGANCDPCNGWYGVECENNRVRCIDLDGVVNCGLDLIGNNLIGTIPDINLSNLEILILSGNDGITGNLPSFTSISNIEVLRCDLCSLSGALPNLSLPVLRVLSLEGNNLSDELPTFDFLPVALFFRLNDNGFIGSLPEFNDNPILEDIRLEDNALTGEIPSYTHLNLLHLRLQNNNLSGCYPDSICNILDLTTTGNPLLPWEGDVSQFCNGQDQIGAPCNDGDPTSANDQINPDCSCGVNSGITINNLTVDESAGCAGSDPDSSPEFQAWLASNGGGLASSACGTITDPWTNDYNPANWIPNSCGFDITVTFTVMDNCGSLAMTTSANYSLIDNNPPTFVVEPQNATFECNGTGNAPDIQEHIDTYVNELTPGDLTDDCSDSGDVIVTLMHDWDGSGVTTFDCNEEIEITFTIMDNCGNATTTNMTITIEDTRGPTIDNPIDDLTFECDMSTNASFIQDWVNNRPGLMVTEGCDSSADITNDWNGTIPECGASITISFIITDDCGNETTTTGTVTTEDTTPPEFQAPFSSNESYDCFSDVPPLNNLATIDACEGVGVVNGIEDLSQVICDSEGILTREYILQDLCGNAHPDNPFVQTITIGNGPTGLQWIDPGTVLPSGIFFDLNVVECQMPYSFPDCVWLANPSDPSSLSWPFPLQEGIHYESTAPCPGGFTFSSTEIPCDINLGSGSRLVTYTLTDDCGNSLTHSFTVDANCLSCSGGVGQVCSFCEDASPSGNGGCYTCDINELASGVSGCSPPWTGTNNQPGQPSPLCGGGVPNNMSWFAFTAGSTEIDATVCPNGCIPGGSGLIGIQAGIYDACGGSCLSGDDSCPGDESCKDFNLNGMIIGNTYYIFVDGCAGSECQWDISITGQAAYVIDNMESVVVESDCNPLIPGRYCPGQMVAFNVYHAGDSPSDNGSFDGPGPYDPGSDLCFDWSSSPGLDGYNEVVSQGDNGAPGPMVELPFVSLPTTYTICIEDVYGPCENACDDGDCVGNCCLDFIIAPYPDELYEFDVCYEDLEQGWDPSEAINRAGGMVPWGGGLIGLGDVGNQICAEAVDPECGCNFFLKVTVNLVGEEFKEPYTFFMYDCQFKDLDGNFEDYEWIHPETFQEEIIPYNAPQGLCIYLVELSEDEDWNRTRCDFPIEVSVQTTEVLANLTPGPCTHNGTEYCWALDLDGVDDDWPEIDPNYLVEWVLCDDPEGSAVGNGNCFSITTITAGEYCVRVSYSFFNSDYPDGGPEENGSCAELFGPYMLDSDVASPPIIEGVTEFCANDLIGKEFSIDVPAGSTDTYTWNVAGTGAVISTQSANGAQITFDLTGYDFSQPIIVDANTACGISQGSLTLTSIPIPTPEIGAIDDICLTGGVASVSEIFYGAGNAEIADYIWTPNNNNSATVDYVAVAEGQQDIMLTVIDLNGCMSDPVSASYLVVPPLSDPQVQCGNLTDSSIEFVWKDVLDATGYIIDVTGAAAFSDTNYQLTNYIAAGLNVNETVFISVTAIGSPPCGNSATVTWECETTDCPAPLTTIPQNGSDQICTNDAPVTFTFDLDGTIMDSDGRFDVVLGPDPAASYYDQATGTVDPAGLPAGEYTISSRYFYNNDDCDRQGPTYTLTVNEAPVTEFTFSSTFACIGESVQFNNTTIGNTTSIDLDGGVLDANNNISWTISGVKSVQVVTETIEGCIDSSTQTIVINEALNLGTVTCGNLGLDSAIIDWDEVENALSYSISYKIDGVFINELEITESEYIITDLIEGDQIEVMITINPENGQCMGLPEIIECIFESNSCAFDLVADEITTVLGQEETINLLFNDNVPSEYSWQLLNIDESQIDVLDVSSTGLLSFTVTDDFGEALIIEYEVCIENCPDCMSSTLTIKNDAFSNINPTNVISPNNDGLNDVLRFNTDDEILDSKLIIFNRWGDVIYSVENYKNDWNASGYPGGVYFYVLEISGAKIKKTLTVFK